MNIKKNIAKAICAVLTCTTLLSSLLTANAIETPPVSESPMEESGWTVDEGKFEEIEVTYTQASSYNVTIPKTILLDKTKQGKYSVKVTGDIDANQRVYVAPVDGITETESVDFYMKDQASNNRKEDVVASVTQNKYYWNSEDASDSYEETNNIVSAPNLTAGTWKGSLQMEIRLESIASHVHEYVDGVCTGCGEVDPNAEHTHNYIDGKCDCGEIDPNHTHNYGEDGVCTICGKKFNPYEVAPASAYSNWNYTLNDDENVITLNYYTGSETNVIVYGSYEVEGKKYKTQIASNVDDATYSTPYMFNGGVYTNCKNIKSILFSENIDTSNVTNMSYMFYQCRTVTNLDLSNLDTSNVTSMVEMFEYCVSLTSISGLDTSNVTDMTCMFAYCLSFVNPDLSNLDTRKVTNMRNMFFGCNKLTTLDLSSFDTSNVTDMNNMFGSCEKLRSLNLSSFDTNNVTNMGSMFRYCEALSLLDLSSFDTSNVTDMRSMFEYCRSLKTIYVTKDKWHTASTNKYMFEGCGTSSVTYK